MARRCDICDKGKSTGFLVSHSNKHTKRTWKPNIQRLRVIREGRPQRLYVCTSCIKSGRVTKAL